MEKKKNKKMTKDNNRKNMIKTEKMTVTINLKMTDKEKKNKEDNKKKKKKKKTDENSMKK